MSRNNCACLIRFLGLVAGLLLSGCGNEFRPVAIPIPQPPGTPQLQKHAVVVSDSPLGGTATNIAVSGDTIFTVREVPSPVHAALVGSRTVVANSNDSLSIYVTLGSLTISPITTVSLPTGSVPFFVHSRDAANAYVILQADPSCGGEGSVAVVSLTSLTLTGTVCVGTHPVAMTQLPNLSKLYVVDQDDNNVTVINTADRSIAATIPVGSSPSAIEVTPDGSFVYVANTGSNDVSVISTTTDQEFTAHPRVDLSPGVGPSFVRYGECPGQNGGAPTRKRIYVTNPGSGSVSVIDADSSSTNTMFLNVTNVTVGASPVALSQLANCTKVYVANGAGANSVSVIDGASLAIGATIPVGLDPIAIESSPDSAQVFVADNGPAGSPAHGNVSVIRTSDDTKISDIAVPPPPSRPPNTNPQMTPKVLLMTP